MPQVRITKPFVLTRNDGTQQAFSPSDSNLEGDAFEPGLYEVSQEEADHWFLQHHTNKPPKPFEGANSMEAIQRAATAQAYQRRQDTVALHQEHEAVRDIREKNPRPVVGPAKDPIGTPAPQSKNSIPRATPVNDEGDVQPAKVLDKNDHDQPRQA